MTDRTIPEVVQLLHEVDGHLGLAVHRNEHDQRWKDEALDLIERIRKIIPTLSAITGPGPNGEWGRWERVPGAGPLGATFYRFVPAIPEATDG